MLVREFTLEAANKEGVQDDLESAVQVCKALSV